MTRDLEPASQIKAALAVLRAGGVVAMPTETVYGLAADASNRAAVQRIFALKGRPADHPVIVHVGSKAALEQWARDIPPVAHALVERFWPGPLTLILPAAADVLPEVTGGQTTVGLRMPRHPLALALLREFGGGLAAPSANRFGHVSPTQAAHVAAEFGTDIDIILDGGACEVGLESTILDLSGARPRLLRPGAIGPEALAEVLGERPQGADQHAPRAPGTLAAHYAPRTPLHLVPGELLAQSIATHRATGQRVAVLALRDAGAQSDDLNWRVLANDAAAYAHDLYAGLRQLDAHDCDVLLVECPPDAPAWQAVNDRLRRAASNTAFAPSR